MACAPSEDSDQPRHPPSLIGVFAVRMNKVWVLSYPLNAQRRFWSDWADAEADLSSLGAHAILLVLSRDEAITLDRKYRFLVVLFDADDHVQHLLCWIKEMKKKKTSTSTHTKISTLVYIKKKKKKKKKNIFRMQSCFSQDILFD